MKEYQFNNEENFPQGREVNGKRKRDRNNENYLKKLSGINENVEFPIEPNLFSEEIMKHKSMTLFDDSVMKSLEDSDVNNLQKVFNKFYIITYEIDQINMISSIRVWIPSPVNDKAYLVEDLTELINTSSVDLTDLDTSVLENDQFDFDYESPNAIDYNIFHEDDLSQEDEGNDES